MYKAYYKTITSYYRDTHLREESAHNHGEKNKAAVEYISNQILQFFTQLCDN